MENNVYVYSSNNNNNNNRNRAVRPPRHNVDETPILHNIAQLMGKEDILSEILGNDAFADECKELIAISKLSRMDDEDRLKAYESTFQKIQTKLAKQESDMRQQIRSNQNRAYEEGERSNRVRFHIRNTVKAKRSTNKALLQATRNNAYPKNIQRILQQGRFAKPENAQRAKQFTNRRNQTIANLEKRLTKYSAIDAKLNGKHLPYTNYVNIAKELE